MITSFKDMQYIILDGKTPTHGFKDGKGTKTFEEAKSFDNLAVIVPDGYVVLDFDTASDAEIMLRIIDSLDLKTLVFKTTRGIHCWFKSPEKSPKCFIKTRLAIGLYSDRKAGGRNAYVKIKQDGHTRKRLKNIPLEDLDTLPKWLTAVSAPAEKFSFIDMGEGSGRNQELFNYIAFLQSKGFSREDIRTTIDIINTFVFAEALPDYEIATICRDEAFKPEEEIAEDLKKREKVVFQHNIFAEELIQERKLISVNGIIYEYYNGYYRASRDLERYVRIKKPDIKNNQIAEVIRYIKDMKRLDPEELRVNPFIINLKNTRLNVKTGDLLDFDPEAIEFDRIPVVYDPRAHSADLDNMLRRVFCEDKELIDLFGEMVGYCLLKTLRYEKAFILYGSGANGKSTILDLIKVFLGSSNYSAIPLNNITDRFSTAELENKLANIGDDIGDARIRENGKIKQLISGKTLQVERKGEKPFELVSYATQIHACNEIPGSLDVSSGFYRRFIYIPFEAVFRRSDPDYDPDIFDKITTPEALSYLLNLALRGIDRLISNKGFTKSKATNRLKHKHRIENSPVLSWLSEADLKGLKSKDYILSKHIQILYSEFSDYCKISGVKVEYTSNRFYKEIRQEFNLAEDYRKSNGHRYFKEKD